jgi:GNAT superfamily N-acetyltransferase
MTYILQDLSPSNLSAAIEANMFPWLPFFGNLPGAQYIDTGELKRAITKVPNALFNSIMDARLPEEKVDRTIQGIIDDARSRRIPLRWWTGPLTRPQNLTEHLERFGFTRDDHSPGMAVELAKLNASLPRLEGLSIRLCKDEYEKRLWSQAMGEGFEFPSQAAFVVDAWADLLIRLDTENVQPYLAWWNDKPVATCLLFLGAGVAGIYAVATVSEARRKGIGAWVTLYPLLQAREMGYRAGVLASSDMGFRVYRSLGFEEYCKISSYNWRP